MAAEWLKAKVDFDEYLGGTQYLYCQLEDGQVVIAEHRSSATIGAGETIHLASEMTKRRYFDAAGKRLSTEIGGP